MERRYYNVRFPAAAYVKLREKQAKIAGTMAGFSRKGSVNVPLTKVLIAITENPITLDDAYLKNLFGKRKRGNPYAK